MLNRWSRLALFALFTFVIVASPSQASVTDDLQTVAESSDFQATSTFEDVVEFLDKLAATSDLATRVDLGQSHEGRTLPMIVLADPPVQEPGDLVNDDRIVVLIIGNIHGGEVDGKEALMILARDLLDTDDAGLLDELVLCIAPIYNADGNEQFALDNRPGQDGPAQGMGQRHNAQNLDLNRDFLKLEAPETRALIRFTRHWDPDVFIDAHTTNGSFHRYLVTWAGPKVPAGDAALIDYFNNTMMPAVTSAIKADHDIDIFPYGNFADDHTRWESFPAHARYGTSYFGLRNVLSILSESYSYAPYEDRIHGSRHFIESCLDFLAQNSNELRRTLAQARSTSAGRAQRGESIALRSRPIARDEDVIALGYVEERVDGRTRPTDEHQEYTVQLRDVYEGSLNVKLPRAYLIPERLEALVQLLQFHGIEIEQLTEDIQLQVEVDRITEINRQQRAFQGHHLTSIEIDRATEDRMIRAGHRVVFMNQPLAPLAAYLLESQSEDGLVTWNFLDEDLAVDASYPILRVLEDEPLSTIALLRPDDERTFGKRITTDPTTGRSSGGANFNGSPTRIRQWDDDEHYVQRKGNREYRINVHTGRTAGQYRPPAGPSVSTGDMQEALEQIATIAPDDARALANSARRNIDPTNTGAWVEYGNDIYYVATDGSIARRLTSTPESEELIAFSPNGRLIAFVRANDLYVVDVDTATERALTTGGSDTLRRGKLDWVYFEEVFGRRWNAFWWSPDSTAIAFIESDSSDVPDYTLVDDKDHDQRVEIARYPKPGEPNPVVRLGVVSAAGDAPTWIDLSDYNPHDLIIGRVFWQDDSRSLLLYLQNRVQNWLDISSVNARGGKPTRWWRETTGAWVNLPDSPYRLPDGSFLLESERTGFKHWHHYTEDGKPIRAVTHGPFTASRIVHYDSERDWLYFMGNGGSRIGSDLYRVHLDGSQQQMLTNGRGTHRITLSPDATYFIDAWSDFETPEQTQVCHADGKVIRTIDTNPIFGMDEYDLGQWHRIDIPARDGYPLDGYFILPPDYEPGERYPVWLSTYAGPSAPTVRDRWGGAYMGDQSLASEGIILLHTDPRSASARSAESAWTAYKQLGVPELRDIEDVVQHLIDEGYADPDRIGMTGYSYGGFMTAFALTHSTMFSCGIAGAPPTDWTEYDTIYTERYMLTPQDNPDGYRATSVIEAAGDLHGFLRINHGTMDDNVHPQNTTRLIRALQEADKDFEAMFYPGYRHGIFNRHYSRSNYDFIINYLNPDQPPIPPTRSYQWKHVPPMDPDAWYDEGD